MKTEFFMAMVPPSVTYQQKKRTVVNGRAVVYDSPEVKDARAKLTAYAAKFVPEMKYTSGVRLVTKWCFPIKGKHKNGEYKTSKPDTDNLQKLLKDVFTELGFWKDDALVASEVTEKFWAEIPGIYIRIEEL